MPNYLISRNLCYNNNKFNIYVSFPHTFNIIDINRKSIGKEKTQKGIPLQKSKKP